MNHPRLFALVIVAALAYGCSGNDHDNHDHPAAEDHSDHDHGDHKADDDATFATLSPEDAKLAKAQKTCPVSDEALGSMGDPIKVMVGNKPVFICCEGCRKKLLRDPNKYLAKLAK